jgi:hypothetical protein
MNIIRGDIITNERKNQKDVVMIESERGGVSFQTLSYFDVLLENTTITKPQAEYGKKFWSVREVAQRDQDAKTARLEYASDCSEDEIPEAHDYAEEGVSAALYLELITKLHRMDFAAINACCYMLDANDLTNRMMIFRAFGEIALKQAFAALERIFPVAEENAIIRVETAKQFLHDNLNMLDSLTDTCVRSVPKTQQPAHEN